MTARILTVDDSASIRLTTKVTLSNAGYDVTEAAHGGEGLEKAKLGQFDLIVTDLARARAWWVDLIGFHVQHEEPGALYLRGYEEFVHHSVTLREGPAMACARMGFRVRTPEDVDRAERYFDELGCPTRRVPAGTTPGFGDALRTVDPLGFTIELVHEIEHVEPLVQRYDLRRGASINRLDHINIHAENLDAARDFLLAVLPLERGFRPPFDFKGYWLYLDGKPIIHMQTRAAGMEREALRVQLLPSAEHRRDLRLHRRVRARNDQADAVRSRHEALRRGRGVREHTIAECGDAA